MTSDYYQIPMVKESDSKTAFVTPDGRNQFFSVPFGMTHAPAILQ